VFLNFGSAMPPEFSGDGFQVGNQIDGDALFTAHQPVATGPAGESQ
jgi:hypothetical protein